MLYLEDTNLFKARLDRKSHHNYQSFSIENSINQQNIYLDLGKELEGTKIKVIPLAMDDFEKSYEKVKELLEIKN